MTPIIHVCILQSPVITVETATGHLLNGAPAGNKTLTFSLTPEEKITCDASLPANEYVITPVSADDAFTLRDVTIGIGFHWEQKESQTFHGSLRIISDGDNLLAINEIDVESYLQSVVSSEMNANAPEEFLKAHAVISRSWALAQIQPEKTTDSFTVTDTPDELIKWYDHSAHTLFDVCADDHCQRYQGVTKAGTPQTAAAIRLTRGEVLISDGELCDARFSKCCGGITEKFSTCWQPVDMPYLSAISDTPAGTPADVSQEADASQWILSHPDAFCSEPSPEVLSMVLNSYDLDTPHLYRWSVEYSADELADIIRQRTGTDYGRIIALEPLHRGPSGRIDRLRISATKHTRIIGKELEIRRSLSRSHLYSSAFVVEPGPADSDGLPSSWRLIGAGWGHGAGLCQIGAAVMATEGYDYRQILKHYFRGAEIKKIY